MVRFGLPEERTRTRLLVLLPLAAWVAGCVPVDPYARPGTWRPTDVNTANLRAMVAVPSDLVAGHGDNTGNGEIATMALNRFHRDAVRPLPDSLLSKVGAPAGGTQAAPNAAGPAGGSAGGAPGTDNGGS